MADQIIKWVGMTVYEEEINKDRICESCGIENSKILCCIKEKRCIILCHLCSGCNIQQLLNESDEKEYKYVIK